MRKNFDFPWKNVIQGPYEALLNTVENPGRTFSKAPRNGWPQPAGIIFNARLQERE